jgi:hypothetical protein
LGHIKYYIVVFLLPFYFFWLGQDGNTTRRKNDVNFVFPKRKIWLRESKVSTVFEAAAMTGAAMTGSRGEELGTVAEAAE